ncbi:hypothetical protein H6G33_17040 [Calothrix sp. FACHB-1219]|uniref:hypothetical protein n=1 Tax=unclassified Calothrix TaxID=2619626 RepID=UPI001681C8D9|nr:MULTISPECIES: hypothetical protein [unclassified Calothrix]MBD2203140.1 hypothetical protein [Calothrix sp. FACHB-168]MBD2218741.1 hypothetical protein [Calothrix sp. FACHB-1219]
MTIFNRSESNQTTSSNDRVVSPPRTLRLQDAILLISLVMIAAFVKWDYTDGQGSNRFPNLTSTSEVTTNTGEFIGETITIRSKPVKTINSNSFIINDRPGTSQESLLVVNASNVVFQLPLNSNKRIEIKGEVRRLVIPEIERDFNLDLPDADYTSYLKKPVIIAKSISLVN